MQSSSQSLQSSQRTNRSYVLECLIYLWFLSCLSTFVSFSYILATLKNGRKNKWQGQKKLTSKKALWLTRSDAFHSPCVVRLGSFLLRKEEFERIRNEKRTILDETLEKDKDSSRSNSKLCKMFFEKGFFGNSKAFHGMDQVMD